MRGSVTAIRSIMSQSQFFFDRWRNIHSDQPTDESISHYSRGNSPTGKAYRNCQVKKKAQVLHVITEARIEPSIQARSDIQHTCSTYEIREEKIFFHIRSSCRFHGKRTWGARPSGDQTRGKLGSQQTWNMVCLAGKTRPNEKIFLLFDNRARIRKIGALGSNSASSTAFPLL